MPLTLTTRTTCTINWSHVDKSVSLSTISDVGVLGLTKDLPTGSGMNKNNLIYHDQIELPSGVSQRLDLTNLTQSLLSDTFPVNFSGGLVNCIVIQNTFSEDNADILVGATGSVGLAEIFNDDDTYEHRIRAGTPWIVADFLNGFSVDEDNKEIQIDDVAGSGVVFDIIIIGQSGNP